MIADFKGRQGLQCASQSLKEKNKGWFSSIYYALWNLEPVDEQLIKPIIQNFSIPSNNWTNAGLYLAHSWLLFKGQGEHTRLYIHRSGSFVDQNALSLGEPGHFFQCGQAAHDLAFAVIEQRLHAARPGGLADLAGRGAVEGQLADLVGHLHHLEDALPAAEAGLAAALATGAAFKRLALHVRIFEVE